MASTSHLAELEIEGTDVIGAWNALEPVIVDCAGLLGTPATRSDYCVGNLDDRGTVAGADLHDCLDHVENPASIFVTYTTKTTSSPDPHIIELKIMRYRRFKDASTGEAYSDLALGLDYAFASGLGPVLVPGIEAFLIPVELPFFLQARAGL